MSKAERLRELQEEINSLKYQLKRANERLAEYQKRDRPQAGDFVKVMRK